jgi:hypothetical protein
LAAGSGGFSDRSKWKIQFTHTNPNYKVRLSKEELLAVARSIAKQ